MYHASTTVRCLTGPRRCPVIVPSKKDQQDRPQAMHSRAGDLPKGSKGVGLRRDSTEVSRSNGGRHLVDTHTRDDPAAAAPAMDMIVSDKMLLNPLLAWPRWQKLALWTTIVHQSDSSTRRSPPCMSPISSDSLPVLAEILTLDDKVEETGL